MVGKASDEFKHEEADLNIIYCLLLLIKQGEKCIQVVCDDNDIFALLLYFCLKWKTNAKITMKKSDGHIIDINTSAQNLGPKCQDIPTVNVFSGCDSCSYPC